ncbi:hypothetical protein [Nocardia sp. BMG51109]
MLAGFFLITERQYGFGDVVEHRRHRADDRRARARSRTSRCASHPA